MTSSSGTTTTTATRKGRYFFPIADISSGDLLDLSDDATTTFTGDSDGDYFGYTLGGGDLDFDGYDDLVSASAAEDVGGVERARMRVRLYG